MAISRVKCGMAGGPSGIVVDMVKASSETGIYLMVLSNSIMNECGSWQLGGRLHC